MKTVIGFHRPEEINGSFSNWYLSDFVVDGIKYSSMEQYMMHKKALLFEDTEIASQILRTSNPGEIKNLGRCVSNYNNSVWNGVRQLIVYKGLLEKFRQNDDLSQKLLETGENILAECAVHDLIWGIGISMTDPARFNIHAWRGQNLLGYALMMVREELHHTPSK